MFLQLNRQYGDDVRHYVLRCLLEEISFDKSAAPDRSPRSPSPSGSSNTAVAPKDVQRVQLLVQELTELGARPSFAANVCRALEVRDLPCLQHLFTNFRWRCRREA